MLVPLVDATQIKRKKVDYDFEDPFIDDSELSIDAPTHTARPKKEGFYVHCGPLELLEEYVSLLSTSAHTSDHR